MSRRDRIVMTGEETADFLAAGRTVTCASNGRDGRPHLMRLSSEIAARYGGAVTWDHRKLGGIL